MQVKQGDTVKVHYEGKLEDGTVFDSSKNRDPLQFTVGTKQVIPGFEQAVLNMAVGDEKTITLQPEEAYGPYSKELVQVIDRSNIPPNLELEVGKQLQMATEDNHRVAVTITDLTDEKVTLDANHFLAGKALIFELKLSEIQ